MGTPRIRIRDTGGTLRTIDGSGSSRIRARDDGGTLRTITRIRVRDQNNVLRVVYDPAGTSTFTATAFPESVSGFSSGTGTVTTGSTTVTPAGGTAPYIHAWTVISFDGGVSPTVSSPSSDTTSFVQTSVGNDDYFTATFRDTVTDSASPANTTTVDVDAGFVGVP